MAVIVGSARHDENGEYHGGQAGDQTGEEVSKQEWYLHKKGWVCIRAKDSSAREKIAKNMEYACANSHIGYDQYQNTSLYAVAKKVDFDCSRVKTNCETDCARLVRVCVLYAGIQCEDFYTGNEVDALEKTGKFDILREIKYTTTSKNLRRGDILVTKTKGHTVVVLNNGENITSHSTLRSGDSGKEVIEMQEKLISLGVPSLSGKMIKATGKFGSQTESTVKNYQTINSLKVDGICGNQTWSALDSGILPKITTTTAVNCRNGASSRYRIIRVLPMGYTDYCIRMNGNWVYLKTAKGWVSKNYVDIL